MNTYSPYQLDAAKKFRLADHDPDDCSQFPVGKSAGKKMLPERAGRIAELHHVLCAERKHKVLIVVQTTHAGGKDGTIRRVFQPLDPAGFRVVSFKAPSALELSHDYLWRIHQQAPCKGEIVVFNRSHYEDIIAVGVKNLAPKEVWQKRYDHIRDFERMLTDEGTLILKFFLHISKDEQRERLQERVDLPEKNWKFQTEDLVDRRRWDDIMSAYETLIGRTSTDYAPWFVIPANRKWHRNLAVAEAVANALQDLDMAYPEPDFDPAQYRDIE